MKKIGIFYCSRIKDHSCVGCAKCFKAVKEHNGEFERYKGEDAEIVFMTDCGDCPGLIMPRVDLALTVLENLKQKIDAIHLGTCIKKAAETSGCNIKPEEVAKKIQTMFGIPVVVGTQSYPRYICG